MAYNQPPWVPAGQAPPTGIARVTAIRNYIKNQAFERKAGSGKRVLWNGATVDDHRSTDSLVESSLVCNLLNVAPPQWSSKRNDESETGPLDPSSSGYITRDTLSELIDNEACGTTLGQISGGTELNLGTYLDGTPEKVNLFIEQSVDDAPLPSSDDCKQNMHKVRDECGDENPLHWKAGGYLDFDGWTYTIAPLGDRPPAPTAPKVWCTAYKDEIRMWGAGCLNSGFGKELKDAFNNAGYKVSDEDFFFQYENLNGHEWQATVPNTDIGNLGAAFAPKALEDAVKWPNLQVTCAQG